MLIAPVDRPGWSIELVQDLLKSDKSTCPIWNQRGGHPLLLVGEDINTVYLAERDAPLSSLVRREPLLVEFKWLHLNIDTERDLTALLAASQEDWF